MNSENEKAVIGLLKLLTIRFLSAAYQNKKGVSVEFLLIERFTEGLQTII